MNSLIPTSSGNENLATIKNAVCAIRDVISSFRTRNTISKFEREMLLNNIETLRILQLNNNLGMLLNSTISTIVDARKRIESEKLEGKYLELAMNSLDITTTIMMNNIESLGKKYNA